MEIYESQFEYFITYRLFEILCNRFNTSTGVRTEILLKWWILRSLVPSDIREKGFPPHSGGCSYLHDLKIKRNPVWIQKRRASQKLLLRKICRFFDWVGLFQPMKKMFMNHLRTFIKSVIKYQCRYLIDVNDLIEYKIENQECFWAKFE